MNLLFFFIKKQIAFIEKLKKGETRGHNSRQEIHREWSPKREKYKEKGGKENQQKEIKTKNYMDQVIAAAQLTDKPEIVRS